MALIEITVIQYQPGDFFRLIKPQDGEFWLRNPQCTSEPLTKEELQDPAIRRATPYDVGLNTHRMTKANACVFLDIMATRAVGPRQSALLDGVDWEINEVGYSDTIMGFAHDDWQDSWRERTLEEYIAHARRLAKATPDDSFFAVYYTAWGYWQSVNPHTNEVDAGCEYYGIIDITKFHRGDSVPWAAHIDGEPINV